MLIKWLLGNVITAFFLPIKVTTNELNAVVLAHSVFLSEKI